MNSARPSAQTMSFGGSDFRAIVTSVAHHPYPYFTVAMAVPSRFGTSEPGQFVMTLAGFELEPYLRRAFSVFDQKELREHPALGGDSGFEVEIFGKVIGPGTKGLAHLEVGAEVPLLGPLGRGFELDEDVDKSLRVALVAGGIGSAALLLWARSLVAQGVVFDFYYGGYGAIDLSLEERFGELARASGGDHILSTETGEVGHRGYITEPLEERLRAGVYGALYTCGPEPLMARVAVLAEQYGVVGQAALETEMGCGFGACLGCAVPHRDGRFRLCCKDGPVFDLGEVVW